MAYRIWKYAGPGPHTSRSLKLYLDHFALWRKVGEIPEGVRNNRLIHRDTRMDLTKFLEVNNAFLEPCGTQGEILLKQGVILHDGSTVGPGARVIQEITVPGVFYLKDHPRTAVYNADVVGGR